MKASSAPSADAINVTAKDRLPQLGSEYPESIWTSQLSVLYATRISCSVASVVSHDTVFDCSEQEMQKIGGKSYSVVYFNADAAIPKFPDTTFMQQLHAGLDPSHRRQLQVFATALAPQASYSLDAEAGDT